MPAASIRARVRAEMTAEIKAVARRHLETDGANLSLRAVARDMGMVSSALYRYFASRDDLLTALIVDAYNAIGETVETAEARVRDRGRAAGTAGSRRLARSAAGRSRSRPSTRCCTAARYPATRRRPTPSSRPRAARSC